jgi:hypothetical protein
MALTVLTPSNPCASRLVRPSKSLASSNKTSTPLKRLAMFKTLMLATVLLPSIAFGQSSTSRSFYDRSGSFAGSSVTRGNQTTFTDRNGRFDGTSIRNRDGTTSVYDARGRFVGSSTNTTAP